VSHQPHTAHKMKSDYCLILCPNCSIFSHSLGKPQALQQPPPAQIKARRSPPPFTAFPDDRQQTSWGSARSLAGRLGRLAGWQAEGWMNAAIASVIVFFLTCNSISISLIRNGTGPCHWTLSHHRSVRPYLPYFFVYSTACAPQTMVLQITA
jgi:hypothetical protein